MARKISKSAAATAVAAAFSLLASPVGATELPRPADAPSAYDSDAENVQQHGYGGWGYGDWDDDDIDTGDVIAGVLILGTIAAAVATATHNNRDRYPARYPYPDEDYRYQTPRDSQRFESRGIDRAVDMCVAEVDRRSQKVASVDNAARTIDGWQISGQLQAGDAYSCQIGNDGRIGDVQVGGYGVDYVPGTDNQWDDATYERARIAQGAPPPLPETYESDDGRYESGDASEITQ